VPIEGPEVAQRGWVPVGVAEHPRQEVRTRWDKVFGWERLALVIQKGVGFIAEQLVGIH
jgi:hypothetical protein